MLKKNTCSCLCYYGILLAEDEKIKTGILTINIL